MAKTQDEVLAAVAELKTAAHEQVTQTATLIAKVEELIAAVPVTPDLQPIFDAVVAAKDELVGDNAAVDAALAKINPPPPETPVA